MKLHGEEVNKKWLAKHIEHVIWENDLEILTKEVEKGIEYGFRTIFSPSHFRHEYVAEMLKGTGIKQATPINFMNGLVPAEAAAKQAEIAQKGGVNAIDLYPDMAAYKLKDWKALEEYVRTVRKSFDGEIKVLTMCNDSLDDMYCQVEAIKAGGADFVKAYDYNKMGCPMSRVQQLKAKCDEVGLRLKTSGNGKYWTTAIVMGEYAIGAECISASNSFQIVDDLPVFEALYSQYEV
ncbi:MAG: hypothetical protein IJJ38_03500 [Lachnospiraceae bacterium]|nr:hypothetical protein [Lachnospiraceae bacterium]